MKNEKSTKRLIELPGIIDIHCHIFPDEIADKAVASIGRFYDLEMNSDGKVSSLLAAASDAGITRSYVFSTATSLAQVDSINYFLSNQIKRYPELSAFGTLHPEQNAVEINETIGKIQELGLQGIKLHPDFQQAAADGEFIVEVCRQAAGKLPVLLHAGDPRYEFSNPARIKNLSVRQPECKIIAAHFGGWGQWQSAAQELAGIHNVYVDTSSSFEFMSKSEIMTLFEKFGVDKILFGSDFPMWKPADELSALSSLPVSDEDYLKIVWGNANTLLKSFC
jgi:predicted TIM-barrel fold metal-dependent hydrolase